MFGQQLGCLLADMANTQRIDKTRQRNAPCFFNCCKQIGGRFFAPAFPGFNGFFRAALQRKNICGAANQPVAPKRRNLLFAQPFNVECRAGNKMNEPLLCLRAANQPAGAAPRRFPLFAHCRATAHGAMIRKCICLCAALTPGVHSTHDLRNHVARALHDDRVADTHILARDLIFVVQRSTCYRAATHFDRYKLGYRRQHTGSAYLNFKR